MKDLTWKIVYFYIQFYDRKHHQLTTDPILTHNRFEVFDATAQFLKHSIQFVLTQNERPLSLQLNNKRNVKCFVCCGLVLLI